jgi:hypothetical protein
VTARGRLAWLLVGVTATVTAIATAGVALWYLNPGGQHGHSTSRTVSYTGQPDLVTVQLSDGSLTIRTGTVGQVTVTRQLAWSGTRPDTDEHWHGRTFVVTESCSSGFGESCTVNYTIFVPTDVALNLQTDSGDITTVGSSSPQTQVSSDSGDIRLGFAAAPDSVYASSDSGNVTVLVPPGNGYAVHQQADNGNWEIGVTHNPTFSRSITAISDDGNIRVNYN